MAMLEGIQNMNKYSEYLSNQKNDVFKNTEIEEDEWNVYRAVCSIIDSLVRSKSIFFVMTTQEAFELTNSASRWKYAPKIELEEAETAIERLLANNVIEIFVKGSGNVPTLYSVGNEALLVQINPTKEDIISNQKRIREFLNTFYK